MPLQTININKTLAYSNLETGHNQSCLYLFSVMFQSQTYLAMFKELYDGARETGPFNRDWSNVPVVKDHALQDVKIKNEKERAKYERLVLFC